MRPPSPWGPRSPGPADGPPSNCSGDLHNVLHAEENWTLVREGGRDTGRPIRNNLLLREGLDVWAFTMLRSTKVELSLGLARALGELKRSGIVHCDIKPANTVLHRPGVSAAMARRGRKQRLLKLIDFGEANTPEDAEGDIAGTPGYMAPEMEQHGWASAASDMLSAGAYLLEVWVGSIGVSPPRPPPPPAPTPAPHRAAFRRVCGADRVGRQGAARDAARDCAGAGAAGAGGAHGGGGAAQVHLAARGAAAVAKGAAALVQARCGGQGA